MNNQPGSLPACTSPLSPESKIYDFYLFADGSGFHDHFGGFGAIVTSTIYPDFRVTSCGCCTHTETGRAEFMAILTGLQSIKDQLKWTTPSALEAAKLRKHSILVISDREDLVGSINKLYKRKSNPDLWVQFGWYEDLFNITAKHVKRETNQLHSVVDKLASEMRIVLIDFYNIQKECNHL